MLNAGKYRHRITIRNAKTDNNRDGYGARVGAGTANIAVWAEKTDWNGSEVDEVGRETPVLITRWRIRYRSDIKAYMQVVHGSDVYDIQTVLDFDGLRRELTLETRKVAE